MTKLSVNINKIATLRNARGGNVPDVVRVAVDCQRFGAQGITVHPRPDQRHITHKDVFDLKPVITTEYNIEGNPTEDFHKTRYRRMSDPGYARAGRAGQYNVRCRLEHGGKCRFSG